MTTRASHRLPALLGPPLVKGGLTQVVSGANGLDRGLPFRLAQDANDLFFAVFALSHSSAALSFRSRTLPLSRPLFRGQVNRITPPEFKGPFFTRFTHRFR
jgi:hypothetical protein